MNIQVEKNNLKHDKIFCKDSFVFRQNKKWVKKPTVVNGKKSKVGQPYVANAKAEGTIVKHDKAKKVIVYKQRTKKGYRVKRGHRQEFTRVMINKIRTTASKKAAAEAETTEA